MTGRVWWEAKESDSESGEEEIEEEEDVAEEDNWEDLYGGDMEACFHHDRYIHQFLDALASLAFKLSLSQWVSTE